MTSIKPGDRIQVNWRVYDDGNILYCLEEERLGYAILFDDGTFGYYYEEEFTIIKEKLCEVLKSLLINVDL